MIKKIGKNLKKRKVKIFSIFLLASSLAWFLNKLSESYISNTTFKLNYENVPKGYLLNSVSKQDLDVKLEAIGFQFLSFGLSAKEINIDLSKEEIKDSKIVLSAKEIQKQIDESLPNSMLLKDLDKEAIYFKLVKIITKEIRVQADVNLTLQKNCMLDGVISVKPNSIKVTGPENEVETLERVNTTVIELNNIAENFSETAQIIIPKTLKNTSFSAESIVVKGNVSRFSEKIIDNIPIIVTNLPKGITVKTFPDRAKVLCKAKLDVLKKLGQNNFVVTADYKSMLQGKDKVLLQIKSSPEDIYNASLLQNKVTYIIKK